MHGQYPADNNLKLTKANSCTVIYFQYSYVYIWNISYEDYPDIINNIFAVACNVCSSYGILFSVVFILHCSYTLKCVP